METAIAKLPEDKPQLVNTPAPKRARKSRSAEAIARYFLAKDGSSPAKPELGDEAQNESDALIQAFRSKGGVIYVVMSYRAEAEIQGGNPILVKRPLEK
jgi:superfamily II DNA or RNA helicase